MFEKIGWLNFMAFVTANTAFWTKKSLGIIKDWKEDLKNPDGVEKDYESESQALKLTMAWLIGAPIGISIGIYHLMSKN